MKRYLCVFLSIAMALVSSSALAEKQWPNSVRFMARYNEMQLALRSLDVVCPSLTSENFQVSETLGIARHFPSDLNALVLHIEDTWTVTEACYTIKDVDTITEGNMIMLFSPFMCMFYACGGAETPSEAISALDIIGFPGDGGTGNSVVINGVSFSWDIFDPNSVPSNLSDLVTQTARSINFIAKPVE